MGHCPYVWSARSRNDQANFSAAEKKAWPCRQIVADCLALVVAGFEIGDCTDAWITACLTVQDIIYNYTIHCNSHCSTQPSIREETWTSRDAEAHVRIFWLYTMNPQERWPVLWHALNIDNRTKPRMGTNGAICRKAGSCFNILGSNRPLVAGLKCFAEMFVMQRKVTNGIRGLNAP